MYGRKIWRSPKYSRTILCIIYNFLRSHTRWETFPLTFMVCLSLSNVPILNSHEYLDRSLHVCLAYTIFTRALNIVNKTPDFCTFLIKASCTFSFESGPVFEYLGRVEFSGQVGYLSFRLALWTRNPTQPDQNRKIPAPIRRVRARVC